MRILLFAILVFLPALCQVWMPDGTQVRLRRPGSSPQKGGLFAKLAAAANPPLQGYPARLFEPKFPALMRGGMAVSKEYLERLDSQGQVTVLPAPADLDPLEQSMIFWKGAAYVAGYRSHPASDRVGKDVIDLRSLEIWISQDFKTWKPFAQLSDEDSHWKKGHRIQALFPLEHDRFLGKVSEDPSKRGFRWLRGLAIFHRQANGRLVWEQDIKSDHDNLILQSPKGIVLLDYFWRVGRYKVLDNRDGRLIREGKLELPAEKKPYILKVLLRPDGNLLIVAGQDPWDSFNAPSSTAHSPGQVTQSSYMAMSLIHHQYEGEKPTHPDATPLRWYILDPATGVQTNVPPPAGFPRELSSSMRDLQFQNSEHLEW